MAAGKYIHSTGLGLLVAIVVRRTDDEVIVTVVVHDADAPHAAAELGTFLITGQCVERAEVPAGIDVCLSGIAAVVVVVGRADDEFIVGIAVDSSDAADGPAEVIIRVLA